MIFTRFSISQGYWTICLSIYSINQSELYPWWNYINTWNYLLPTFPYWSEFYFSNVSPHDSSISVPRLSSTNPLSPANSARIFDQIGKRKLKTRKIKIEPANNILIFIPNRTGGCFLDAALRLVHMVYDIISTKEIRFWGSVDGKYSLLLISFVHAKPTSCPVRFPFWLHFLVGFKKETLGCFTLKMPFPFQKCYICFELMVCGVFFLSLPPLFHVMRSETEN